MDQGFNAFSPSPSDSDYVRRHVITSKTTVRSRSPPSYVLRAKGRVLNRRRREESARHVVNKNAVECVERVGPAGSEQSFPSEQVAENGGRKHRSEKQQPPVHHVIPVPVIKLKPQHTQRVPEQADDASHDDPDSGRPLKIVEPFG